MKRKIEELDRNRSTDLGPVYCKGCGKFFFDREHRTIADYNTNHGNPCHKHKHRKGYSLLSIIAHAEKTLGTLNN